MNLIHTIKVAMKRIALLLAAGAGLGLGNTIQAQQAIPGQIEAESYSAMDGVVPENTSDTGGGQNIGYIDTGDWMDYNVSVTSSGNYNVDFRVASPGGGQLQLKSQGGTVLATVNVPGTGGYQSWQAVTAADVPLVAGTQTLRVYVSNGGWNFNWMVFAYVGTSGSAARMLEFGIPGSPATINEADKTIAWTLPYGTDLSSLAPVCAVSPGATCLPASGSSQSFTGSVHYLVTSLDQTSTQDYTVTARIAAFKATEVSRAEVAFYDPVSFPAADLTALGTTDWSYWGWNGSVLEESNGKAGGTAIGVPTVDASIASTPCGSSTTTDFSFTNGTSPASGSNVQAGAGMTSGATWQDGKKTILSFSCPVGAEKSTLYVWFSFKDFAGVDISIWDGANQIESTVPVSSPYARNSAVVYRFEFGGVSTPANWTFRFTQNGRAQDWSNLVLNGAALQPVVATSSAFDTWATTTKGLSGPNAAFDADPDRDGIPNGIEFVIGGEPNPASPGANSAALLPTVQAQPNNLVVTYTRTDASAYLNPTVEFSATLTGPWTTAADPANATISVVDGSPADTVTVTIPKNGATRLFARLKVVQPNP